MWVPCGARLSAAAAHGYPRGTLQRFPAVALDQSNPVTAAWHSGTPVTVTATATSPAAVAMPMHGPTGGMGVLAMELRSGRPIDVDLLSVTSIFAAQLGTIVASPVTASAPPAAAEAPPQEDPPSTVARA
jgi:hypothetical protein